MRHINWYHAALPALVCFAAISANSVRAQTCIDDDGDGWGWDTDNNTSCQVSSGNDTQGGLRITWAANDASENVSEYEVAGTINDGQESNYFRGNATEFSVRLSDITANFNDTVCIRIRALRTTGTGTRYSEWSPRSCITLPDAPLQPPRLIELSLIE